MRTAMASDQELKRLAARVGQRLRRGNRRVVTAESCTGGWIAKALTDVAGSSEWLESGYVTYSNAAKTRDLGVPARTLARHVPHGLLAHGSMARQSAGAAVAVSGIAGPDGGSPEKPVGTVWFAVAVRRAKAVRLASARCGFRGDREHVRRKSVEYALRLLLKHVPPA